jgi:hypothetical protein
MRYDDAEESDIDTPAPKRRSVVAEDSFDTVRASNRQRRADTGLPKRFQDSVMLSENEDSDLDLWQPPSSKANAHGESFWDFGLTSCSETRLRSLPLLKM